MEQLKDRTGNIINLITALLLVTVFIFAIVNTSSLWGDPATVDFTKWDGEGKDPSVIEHVGGLIFTQYVIPFEVLSLVLLAALIAGLFMARREV